MHWMLPLRTNCDLNKGHVIVCHATNIEQEKKLNDELSDTRDITVCDNEGLTHIYIIIIIIIITRNFIYLLL